MEASKKNEAIDRAIVSAVRTAHHAISNESFAWALEQVKDASESLVGVESMFADDVRQLARFGMRSTAGLIIDRADRVDSEYFRV